MASILLPTNTPPPADATPPQVSPSAVRAGVLMRGGGDSLWLAAPAKGKLRPNIEKNIDGSLALHPVEQWPKVNFWEKKDLLVGGQGERWVLYAAKGEEERLFWPHDNGGRPFLVRVTPRLFAVYRKPNERLETDLANELNALDRKDEHIMPPGLTLDAETAEWHHPSKYALLACDPDAYVRFFIGDHDEKGHPDFGIGNSCLVELREKHFLFIGWRIESFVTADAIHQYHSPVGNNDVPYPYAIGDTHTYLMICDGKIPTLMCAHIRHPDMRQGVYQIFWDIESEKHRETIKKYRQENPNPETEPDCTGKSEEETREIRMAFRRRQQMLAVNLRQETTARVKVDYGAGMRIVCDRQ